MSDIISTKAGVFESGEKDAMGVQYKGSRLIACRNPKLTDYTVADGTEVICDRSFMNMKELKSIILPSSLKAIGESAFSGCKALADIDIPQGVTEIRQATFRDCDSLAAIELPASVTEIDKFAFGRGLTTLVLNAPEIAIDKYAFMNARDFATLMVPAGRADYYRGLLAAMRVKADVEEMEEKTEEPASLLDAFMADPDKVTEETKGIFKSNDMEEKKMKTVTVEVFGKELFLEPKDPDEEEVYDAYSRFKRNGMVFTVDGSEYGPIDLGIDYNVLTQEQIDEFKDFDVAKFFEESGAKEGMLYTNKAWTTIEIEMPEDEEFKANKACLVTKKFLYPDGNSDVTVCAFGYDGKLYDCAPGDSNGISGEKIWPYDPDAEKEDADDWGGWDDEVPEEEEDFAEESQPESVSENDCFKIEIYGWETFLDAFDEDNENVATRSGIGLPKLIVDGNEYAMSELSSEAELVSAKTSAHYKDIVVTELADYSDAASIYRKIRKGAVVLEVPNNGKKFNPKLAAVIKRKFIYAYHPAAGEFYPTTEEEVVVGFIYDGEAYNVNPKLNDECSEDEVWWTGCTDSE